MDSKVIFAFGLGAAIGSLITWKVVKIKYEQLEENYSVKMTDVHEKRTQAPNEEEVLEEENVDMRITKRIVHEQGYVLDNEEEDDDLPIEDAPYVITSDEYSTYADYETVSLNYFADGVLADDLDCTIDDIEGTVGLECLNRFGEEEEDVVWVRNDARKTDYEIVRDHRLYAQVVDDYGNS